MEHSDTQITKKSNFAALANFDVMSFIKSHLKAARDHIGKKDYLTAKKEAIQVLDFEPDNYNALVSYTAISHFRYSH